MSIIYKLVNVAEIVLALLYKKKQKIYNVSL